MLNKPLSELRVFYIPTRAGFPYNPGIEGSIISGLQSVTSQVMVATTGTTNPLIKQISAFQPDIVFTLLIGSGLDQFTLRAIRNVGPPIAAWATEDPYSSDVTVASARDYNYVFTIESGAVDRYRLAGCPRVWHMPLGYNPDIFRPGEVPPAYRSDICFLGVAFGNRLSLIDQIRDYLLQKKTIIVGHKWKLLPRYGEVAPLFRNKIVPPEEARAYYAGAKIVLNIHRRPDDDAINANRYRVQARSPNVRTFEICACAACQLTDFRSDLTKWYTPGQDLDVFNDAADLQRKLEYYLEHDDHRRRIAASGYEKTKAHTYAARLATILRLIKENPNTNSTRFNDRLATWNGFARSVHR